MFPVAGAVSGSGRMQVGFVILDADLIDAGDGGPEANEVVDLAGIAAPCAPSARPPEALAWRSCFMRAKRTKLSRTFSNLRALAVKLEALLGGAVEAEGDVLEGQSRTRARVFSSRNVPLVESRVEMLCWWQNSMRSKILRIHERLAQADQHHVLGGSFRTRGPDDRKSRRSCRLFGLLMGLGGGTSGSRGYTSRWSRRCTPRAAPQPGFVWT